MNKTSGGDGIPAELFQVLKYDAVKVLHSIWQQIWKTQQWPQDWKRLVFIPVQRKAIPNNAQTTAQLHSSHWVAGGGGRWQGHRISAGGTEVAALGAGSAGKQGTECPPAGAATTLARTGSAGVPG